MEDQTTCNGNNKSVREPQGQRPRCDEYGDYTNPWKLDCAATSSFVGKQTGILKRKKSRKWIWCNGSQWWQNNTARRRTCTIWCPRSSSPCCIFRKHAKCTPRCRPPTSKSQMLNYSWHTISESYWQEDGKSNPHSRVQTMLSNLGCLSLPGTP